MKKLFGTDGIRGIAYEFLTEELAVKVGEALGSILKDNTRSPTVVIGGDTRESYGMLLSALTEGLVRVGANVHVAGTVPTPAIAYFTATLGFDAGVMISASHNPYRYNGIKILARGGFKLSDEEELEIERLVDYGKFSESGQRGKVTRDKSLLEKYVAHLKSFGPEAKTDLRAVIDCANGSAAATAREVFSFLGKDTVFIGTSPDGRNINDGCGSTDLSLLSRTVTALGADIGIAFDGDADRFLAVDERGNEVDGDFVLAILAEGLKEKGRLCKMGLVGTVTSNMGLAEFAKDIGCNFVAAKVGDRYVLEEMERCGYSLGGEQSGHTIIREAATTGDGQLTALYVLLRMAETAKPLSSLASVMRRYPQHTVNVAANAEAKERIASDAQISELIDLERARIGHGRILVRASGTEPVVRIMVEAPEAQTAKAVCESIANRLRVILMN